MVIKFVVQFETFIDNNWRPVIRYDTAHGFAHKDVLNFKGKVIEKIEMTEIDYKQALQIANIDIETNWKKYKEKFFHGE